MHDQREWETLHQPSQTVGPMSPGSVIYHWGVLLAQGMKPERLQAYAILADGGTVYLLGPHRGPLPNGLSVYKGRVSLYGVDERGQPVRIEGLPAELTDIYLFVCEP